MASTSQCKQTTKPVDQGTTKARLHKGPTWRARQATSDATHASDGESTVDRDAASGRNTIMPKGSKVGLLPSVLSSSKTKYFATLLAALFASEDPFDNFLKTSPAFLATCRTAFESVWPYLNVTVETDDVLFNVVSVPFIIIKHCLSSIQRVTNV
jgi:hypothetical protein